MPNGNGLCIFHAPVEKKNNHLFSACFDAILTIESNRILVKPGQDQLAGEDEYYSASVNSIPKEGPKSEFVGFVFPPKCCYFHGKQLDGSNFFRAEFHGDADFNSTNLGIVSFSHAIFFGRSTSFECATFERADFSGSRFSSNEGVSFR
ncbi:MAG: hypothetical protein Q9M17_04100, partial [Mariprofundus sp.]|nr:hypothetical protein [Mariprofundus sp.]